MPKRAAKVADAQKTPRSILRDLQEMGDPDKAVILRRFFKTGKGEYGEGDCFIGITVPVLRKYSKCCGLLSLDDCTELLSSPIHEARFLAVILLADRYRRGDATEKEKIFGLYLKNTKRINQWDLVDVSAPHIVGAHLFSGDRQTLYHLAKSDSIWERRIAIVSTFHMIRKNDLSDTLAIAEILSGDSEDLIHKATGWMLREAGKRDRNALVSFLNKYSGRLPRTMLRYAIEKFPQKERACWMKKTPKPVKQV